MKRYKLLKNLPFAKAGTIFRRISFKSKDGLSDYDYLETNILLDGNQDETVFSIKRNYFINNFDEWFEEVEEPEEYFIINFLHLKIIKISTDFFAEWVIENLKSLGLLFETEEEAEKYLEYLKAKEVIKKDTKGFNPNWEDKDEDRFMGCWDFKRKRTRFDYGDAFKTPEIYFKSREDISESFEKHPKEWKTYLTYE